MTLDSKLSKAVYQGNGSTTVFPFAFKVWNTSQITVTMTDAAGASTDVTSNCTVTLTSSGGSVTYPKSGSPLPGSAKLAITRNMPFTQGINLTTASRFDPQVLEDGLDQGTAERQQMLEQMARAVILPPTSNESPEDVVQSIYSSRDAAATSASAASVKATAAEASAQAAANSASTAAQTVETAAAEAVSAATAQANAAHDSALAAAQSAAEAEAASSGLAPRMDAVELVAASAKAVTDLATETPGAGKIPKADSNNKLDAWVSQQTQFATCATAAATAAKGATLTGFSLVKGARVFVIFANSNTVAGALTLNVNGTGAKSIYNEFGAVSASNPAYFPAGLPIEFVYDDGGHWRYYTATATLNTFAFGASGHQKLPSGLIIQLGSVSANNTYAFPVTFPNAVIAIAFGRVDGGNGTPGADSVNASNFVYRSLNVAGTPARYIAMGY